MQASAPSIVRRSPKRSIRAAANGPISPYRKMLRPMAKEIVARETLKLNARRAELEPIHARDRAEAADRAAFDGTPAGALVHRYEAACERSVQRSFAELLKVRKQSGRDGGERVVAAERPEAKLPKQPEAASKPAAKESASEPAELPRND